MAIEKGKDKKLVVLQAYSGLGCAGERLWHLGCFITILPARAGCDGPASGIPQPPLRIPLAGT